MKKKLLYAIFCAILALNIYSCKTIDCIPTVEIHDSIRVERLLDSVYLYEKDSIYIKEKNDTVYVDQWHTRYKDRIVEKTDTVFLNNYIEKTMPPEKYVPGIYKWGLGFSICFLILFIAYVVVKVYRKFHIL